MGRSHTSVVASCSWSSPSSPHISPQTLTAKNGTVALTVPGGWREELALIEDADLQAGRQLGEVYVVVIAEPKTEFPPNVTPEEFTKVTRGNLLATMKGGSQPHAADHLKIGSNAAIRSDLFGNVDGHDVVYVHTAVETPTRYVQVLAWTLRSRWKDNQSELYNVVGSFEERSAIRKPT